MSQFPRDAVECYVLQATAPNSRRMALARQCQAGYPPLQRALTYAATAPQAPPLPLVGRGRGWGRGVEQDRAPRHDPHPNPPPQGGRGSLRHGTAEVSANEGEGRIAVGDPGWGDTAR